MAPPPSQGAQLNDQMRFFVRHNLANKKSHRIKCDLRGRLASRWQFVKKHMSLIFNHCTIFKWCGPGLTEFLYYWTSTAPSKILSTLNIFRDILLESRNHNFHSSEIQEQYCRFHQKSHQICLDYLDFQNICTKLE